MFKGLKNYFYLNRGEQRAMFILFAIIMIIYGTLLFSRSQKGERLSDSLAFVREIRAFRQSIDSARGTTLSANSPENAGQPRQSDWGNSPATGDNRTYPAALKPFPFDPNTLPEQGWLQMGLTPRLARTIQNYRAKGGHFAQKEDLQKIYGLTRDQYLALAPFVTLPAKSTQAWAPPPAKPLRYEKPPTQPVELNSVDSAGLDELRGIGPVFAMRILRYRDRMGGFARKEQLLEVYGLDSTLYQTVAPFIQIDPEGIKRMDLNRCPLPVLQKHPYVGYYLAKAIADWRVKHGKFRSVEEVRLLPGMRPEKFDQISPYLIVVE